MLGTVVTASQSMQLEGLIESTTYVFSVQALSVVGAGPFREVGFVKTLEDSKAYYVC